MEVLRKFRAVSVEVQWMSQPISSSIRCIFLAPGYVYPQLSVVEIIVHSRLEFVICPWLFEVQILGQRCLVF